MTLDEPRLRALRAKLLANADADHAAYHRAYHKSALRFFGVRAPILRTAVREVFPRPRGRDDLLPLVDALWASPWFEERIAALLLLTKLVRELTSTDLDRLERMSQECEGWAQLDHLAVHIVSALALRDGEPVYQHVRRWSSDSSLWTRRASVLVHILPGRKGVLAEAYAWSTFEELLPEGQFFIRKAIGWTLRELCRHYPHEVHDFLHRVGERASGLTRREGARKLPEGLRIAILGK